MAKACVIYFAVTHALVAGIRVFTKWKPKDRIAGTSPAIAT
jgi:hypothetical protein